MNNFTLYLNLPPKAWARAQYNSRTRAFFTRNDIRMYKANIAAIARAQFKFEPLEGPIYCESTFFFERPKKPKHPIYPIVKPDRDNLDKAVLDALTGICWVDDCQIVDGPVQKRFAEPGCAPGIRIRFHEM